MKMYGLSTMTALSALLLIAAAPLACGGEDTTATTGAGGDGATGAGSMNASSSSSGMGGASTASTGMGGGGGGGTVQDCIDMVMPPNDACGTCACMNCLMELQACQMDMGCVAIRECAQMNMCTGFGCVGPCGMVIDMYGGVGGPSASLALTLSMCVDANCMMQCAPMP